MTKNIMFQGTGSSVGKSLLCAAMCRIAVQDGYAVVPFKSQNMALNSSITKDGREMGRAQVTQAECAKIEPTADMNPVLLKPSSDTGSQVIINGKAAANMNAVEYHKYKPQLVSAILEAYGRLSENGDLVVIEGAGSPAEINLRENDVVNMGMAEMVDAPVILIGDIDKGGVFASIYGTVMLIEPEERARIKGFIINKFRGDVSLLEPGIRMIEEKINIPCLGVIPYGRYQIDEEDSVCDFIHTGVSESGSVTIGVVRLGRISNFTDLTVFDMYDDVSVEFYGTAEEIKRAKPDLLVIPGTKNTIDDMQRLHNTGMAEEIIKKSLTVPVIGICGGYQILGQTISDPNHVESELSAIRGLGLLGIETILAKEKTTERTEGTVVSNVFDTQTSGLSVSGYEIHMGGTIIKDPAVTPFAELSDGRLDGSVSADANVFGTYLHGIFDNDAFRERLLEKLGHKGNANDNYAAFKEEQYELLAKSVRDNLDVDAIYKIAGLKS